MDSLVLKSRRFNVTNRSCLFENELFKNSALFLVFILVVKLLVTVCSVYLYAKFAPFRDANYYLSSEINVWSTALIFNRTMFTIIIYYLLKHLLIYNILVHLFVSFFTGCIFWYVLREEYAYLDKFYLALILLSPHFLIWTSVVGKEVLAITGFLLVIKGCVDLSVWNKTKIIPVIIGFSIAALIRPHYALAYAYLFGISYLINILIRKQKMFIDVKVSLFLVLMFLSLIALCLFCLEPLYDSDLVLFMRTQQQSFLKITDSLGNRWDIYWNSAAHFFYNMGWGIPASIVGFTWSEALARFVMFPVFIEGCINLFTLIVTFCLLIRLIKTEPKYASIIIWGYSLAVLLGLLVNYPAGIFNPGSAVRYKQVLTPLFYFYPLLFIAAIKRKNSLIIDR
ncbi:hypothetical protein [Legionella shakespearei]|uniref:Glycosyltransferase RgtA/B/C/D-like domain-containing protein n=1 Tax=Legionella shakespearei DSM 23087 TaxID=1122169 RepID=A0A0W0YV05_9GAMM|nr:hypothetical protein [Legionella shakespearei]KTD60736.1 hypothetical protein Lsha_1453 [Legionella shakespearei DSM 23087]